MNDTVQIHKETEESLAETFTRLHTNIQQVIDDECRDRTIAVVLPLLDVLGQKAVDAMMMIPHKDQQQFLLAYVSRLKTWFIEAQKAQDTPRIITFN